MQNKNSTDGLVGAARRYVKFGGGIAAEQLAWLRRELDVARAAGGRAVCCCHLCFHPDTCPGACLMYNYEEVLEVRCRRGDLRPGAGGAPPHPHRPSACLRSCWGRSRM